MDMVRHPTDTQQEPQELPGGLWESIKPLTEWIMDNLKIAWRNGYAAGVAAGRLQAIRARSVAADSRRAVLDVLYPS